MPASEIVLPKTRKLLAGFLMLLMLHQNSLAQQKAKLSFQNLQQGLSQQVIKCIYQDHKGFMWFGTQGGLNRFDGTNFVVYENNPHDSGSINHNAINSIVEDKRHNLWIGTATGLNRYNREKNNFEYLYLKKDRPIYVNTLLCDEEGRLWIGTSGSGLYVYDPVRRKLVAYTHDANKKQSISSDFVTAIYVDKDKNTWVGTRSGLDLLKNGQNVFTHFTSDTLNPKSLSHNSISCLKADLSGNIWIGTYGGGVNKIIKDGDTYNFEQIKHSTQPGSLSHNYVLSLLMDKKNNLWVGTENGGLNCMYAQTNRFEHFYKEDGNPQSLSSNSIWSLYEDKNGSLWIGTYNKGLNIYDEIFDRFKTYQRNSFQKFTLADNNVRAFSEDRYGNLWIATDGGGVSYFNTKDRSFSEPIKSATLTNTAVQAVLYDTKENIWIGTWTGGLDRYNKKGTKIKNYRFDRCLKNTRNNVRSIYEDKSGRIWIGTSGSGLFVYNSLTDSFDPVVDETKKSHLGPASFVNAILEGSDNILWVGTSYGLVKIERQNNGGYAFVSFLYNSTDHNTRNYISVNVLYEDTKHNLWVGTGDDLNLFDRKKNTFTIFNKETGLPNNTINGILEEQPGILWISTNKGIFKFNTTDASIHHFTKEDGLSTNEFYGGSCIKTRSGELFFGGNNGFIAFSPRHIKTNRVIPPVYITGFNLFNEPVKIGAPGSPLTKSITETKHIMLDHNQTSFSIEFAALNFTHSQKNQYKYKLEGFDKDWNNVGTKHTATYTNLDAGNYIFKVKGSNNEGLWNNEPTILHITILPPFWKTAWAYFAYLLILIAVIWAFIKFRISQVSQAQKLKLEHEHRIKTEELSKTRVQFFTNVSHELRTPLSLILAPLEQVITHHQLTADVQYKLNQVYNNAGKLYSLVNELMDFTKLEENKLKMAVYRYDIVKFTESLYMLFIDEAQQRKIDYQFVCKESELYVWFDKRKLEKVIINLIQNAFKYTPVHGQIIVGMEKIKKDCPGQVPAYDTGSVRISVTDNGSGIPQEYLDKIFDRFFQNPEDPTSYNTGTGIGLALVKNLVELHRGTIKVSSEKGIKTCFEAELPLGKSHFDAADIIKEPVTDALPFSLPAIPVQSKKCCSNAPLILIAEDNFALRAYLVSVLAEDYRIIEASDGEEGYNLVLQERPDLIISDVLMPRCSGIELCGKVRSDVKTAHIPVILLTAKAAVTEQIEGIAMGADAYVTKPFNVELLQAQISQIIRTRKELCARFSQDVYFNPQNLAANSLDKDFMQKVTNYILENMSDSNLGVEGMSEALNLSRSNLFRKIKAITGKSVVDFIRVIRLKEAIKLMESKKYSIADIAYLTGFRSPAYFTKNFKEQYGKPPSEFLKNKVSQPEANESLEGRTIT